MFLEGAQCRHAGRVFQRRGVATPKARSPAVDSRDRRTTSLFNEADRSRVLEPSSAAHCKSSARYWGAILLRHLSTRTANRNLIRSGTRSQCSSLSSGVTGRTCDGCKSVSLRRWELTVDGPWAVLRCRLEVYFRNQVATAPTTKPKTAELADVIITIAIRYFKKLYWFFSRRCITWSTAASAAVLLSPTGSCSASSTDKCTAFRPSWSAAVGSTRLRYLSE